MASSYSLPPLSTLEAALAHTDPAHIAPELMGKDGLPPASRPSHISEYNPSTSYVYGQGSDPPSEEWYTAAPSQPLQPWDEGYRELQPRQSEGDSLLPKPKKRAKVVKPKATKEYEGELISGELECSDPSGDPNKGPVFVHPPDNATQACVRCHKIKRKCDNARPKCAGCSKAEVPCVFELSAATSVFVHSLKNDNHKLSAGIASAHARIAQLENLLASGAAGNAQDHLHWAMNPQATSSSAPFEHHSHPERDPPEPPRADFSTFSRAILSIRSALVPTSVDQTDRLTYPLYQDAKDSVESFWLENAARYPLLDKADFSRDMSELYRRDEQRGHEQTWVTDNGSEDVMWSVKEFLMFMVIAIGTTSRERTGISATGSSTSFWQTALRRLSSAIAKEDIICLKSLILLGIYSTFEPSIPLWQVVGFATRTAIALNLHRRNDDPSSSSQETEQRKRVFYSLYNLDRLVAVILGKPLAIADDDIDVELPSVLATDTPDDAIPPIALTQHIIKFHRLSGIIHSTLYSVSGSQNSLDEPQRAGIVNNLHARLDTWLAECPVSSIHEGKSESGNHAWFLLNYHQCLCLLYRPSPLYPITTPERLRALHETSTRCVDQYVEHWQEQKVPFNLISTSSIYMACICLLYCLCEYDNRSATDAATASNWQSEIDQRISHCQELLDAFDQHLPETTKFRRTFAKLCGILGRNGPRDQDATNASGKPRTKVTGAVPPVHSSSTGDHKGTSTTDSEPDSAWDAMTGLWRDPFDPNPGIGKDGGSTGPRREQTDQMPDKGGLGRRKRSEEGPAGADQAEVDGVSGWEGDYEQMLWNQLE